MHRPKGHARLVVQAVSGRWKCLELGADRVFDKSNEIDALIQYCTRLAAGDTGNSGFNALA